jgi:hypothetical protein
MRSIFLQICQNVLTALIIKVCEFLHGYDGGGVDEGGEWVVVRGRRPVTRYKKNSLPDIYLVTQASRVNS